MRFKCTLNGMYVGTKPNGQTIANFEASSPEAQFTATLINRPQLVLRGTYGFVAIKGASMKIECNKATPEEFSLEPGEHELYGCNPGFELRFCGVGKVLELNQAIIPLPRSTRNDAMEQQPLYEQ